MTYKNGDKYKGKWANDKREGDGMMEFAEGGKYEGAFANDSIVGNGVFTDKKGNKFMPIDEGNEENGKFVNGMLKGMAELEGVNGIRYQGMYQSGKCHGLGNLCILIEKNGAKAMLEYKGMFKCNSRSGKGKMEWKDNTSLEGEWISDAICKGVCKMYNGTVYEGPFKNDKFNGIGKLKFSDGKEYIGQFANGWCSNIGKIVYPNGDVYEGHL
jgi:hypothetical protein